MKLCNLKLYINPLVRKKSQLKLDSLQTQNNKNENKVYFLGNKMIAAFTLFAVLAGKWRSLK